MAAIFNGMKGAFTLGLWECRACATNSLPVPDSPLINTLILERDKRPMARNTSCIAGASPIKPTAKGTSFFCLFFGFCSLA